ncbi:polyphosphate--glucose phosphotransferase [Corynebacterium fournieri]|uniref:polyphosphate--glucose phosphotransferase n=1 Tax=Corynebacterium fournieri TaxID=1852390 RepID=UPI000A2F27FA|nr:ROK family protein [Corynebacterium fournieri]WJY97721.1 Polyphosphate glucokinase [Corynebacterium fournieri]
MTENALGFGVDIGGSGVKGAVVDLRTGDFVGEQVTVATPQPATPEAVAEVVAQIVRQCEWAGPVGITVPSVITQQVALTAANIDPSWVGANVREVFSAALQGSNVAVLNDADAAGLAEVAFGDEAARSGAVVFLTFGTGIGSAFLMDGTLFPNTELGHMLIDGAEAEQFASSAARDREALNYSQWAQRVDRVLHEFSKLFNPTAFVVGGGISQNADQWVPLLTVDVPVVPAALRNRAGIVGAAMAARDHVAP